MQNNTRLLIARLVLVGVVVGAVAVIAAQNPTGFKTFITQEIPAGLRSVEKKLKTIITPKPPIGNLTPARDLRGTWTSSIKGKGFQLYGQFATGPGTTTIYEDGDVELIISTVENNIASGTIRYTNLCTTGSTAVPGYSNISVPKQCAADSGAQPIQIRVSGSRLDFGTISAGGGTFSMQGNFTTDIISGTMTTTTPYGVVKGEFHLNRVR